MNNRKFQDELGKLKGGTVPTRNNPHKAFVEKLKKQVSSGESSSNNGATDSSDDGVCSENLMKKLEAKFDELFGDLDNDD